ncbi:MAG: redoxin domain-containing protein [Pirellulales bacterium]
MTRTVQRNITWPSSGFLLFGLLALAGACCIPGCTSGDNASGDAAVENKKEPTAEELLHAMAAAYQKADSYADSGKIRIRFKQGDQGIVDDRDFSVSFVRPNKLRMHVYQGIVISDGKTFHASIGSEEFKDEILTAPAPAKLSLPFIYRDEMLAQATQGPADRSLQLALLLADDTLQAILDGGEKPVLLAPRKIDDKMYQGVQIKRPDGTLTFWIDKETKVLRQVEFPTGELMKQFTPEQKVSGLSVTGDFEGAQLGGKVKDLAFQFEAPAGAKLVKRLIPLPPTPSELLGKAVPNFSFTSLDGKKVTAQSLAGKVAVVDFWATWCEPCRQVLPNLQKVYEKYKDNDKVAILAVSIDEPDIKDDQLQAVFKELGVQIAMARDTSKQAATVFKVTPIPDLFIIGPDGKVQDDQLGLNPRMPEELPEKIEKLLAGGELYQETLRHHQDQVREAERAMAIPPEDGAGEPIPPAVIAKASQPKSLKMSRLWNCGELKSPGNILVVETGEKPAKILVHDGWKAVAELGPSGKVAARHELALPENSVVTYLRTASDKEGRTFYAASAGAQQQLHLFDDTWKLLVSYPPEGKHDGIADVAIGDLDGDGKPELGVGYLGVVGVQGVSLEGKRLWANRTLSNVFRLAITGPDPQGRRRLLCTNGRGTLVPIDDKGVGGDEITVPNRFLHTIVAADLDGDGKPEYCAIAGTALGADTAIGLDIQGKELWNYPLPIGVHQQPVERIIAGKLLDGAAGQWVLPGADGSIHIVAADGKPIDQFNYGVALTGVGVAQLDGKPALLVSTAKGVEALRVEAGK